MLHPIELGIILRIYRPTFILSSRKEGVSTMKNREGNDTNQEAMSTTDTKVAEELFIKPRSTTTVTGVSSARNRLRLGSIFSLTTHCLLPTRLVLGAVFNMWFSTIMTQVSCWRLYTLKYTLFGRLCDTVTAILDLAGLTPSRTGACHGIQ